MVRVQALTVVPGVAQSARLESVAYAVGDAEGVQLSTLSVGICGARVNQSIADNASVEMSLRCKAFIMVM